MPDLNTSFYQIFPELTLKQFSCFEMYSMGLSVKQIANKKAISEMAVNKHLKVARDKFDCQTSSELRTIYLCRVLRTISVSIPYATNLV